MPVEEREKALETEYHPQMTEELKENVGKVCNYSDAILSLGMQRGTAKGMAQGMAQGEDNMLQLYRKLSGGNRMEDYERCMNDEKYREQLFYDLGIKKKETTSEQQ